ncbi:MAG: mitofilin family membrane protein, partial [Pseudomonadota bacterium]
MSKTKAQPMQNAEKIIELFGGIRPMAAKIDAPVTTVQGWKKRNVIPANRREQVLSAAQDNNIDLSGLVLDNNAVNETPKEKPADKAEPKKVKLTQKAEPQKTVAIKEKASDKKSQKSDTHEALLSQIESNNRKTMVSSVWLAVLVVLCGLALAAFLLFPLMKDEASEIGDSNNVNEKIEQLETKVDDVDERTSMLDRMIPENIGAKLEALQDQARALSDNVSELSNQANDLANGVLAPDAGRLSDRMAYLEQKVESLSNSGNFSDLIGRVQQLENSVMGQEKLEQSVNQLEAMVDDMQGDDSLSSDLAAAQDSNEGPLGETLQGVSGNDLKAAAMLLAFTKFRDTLNREAPFEDDLILLQRLAGEDNEELQSALLKLAPQADDGILTQQGLSEELKSLTGDIVFSSLQGEDVSIKEKAVARLNNVLHVEKDGEPVLGTDTQKTIAEAQKLLDEGDVQGAMTALNQLDGEAAETAQPFLEKAEANLLAGQVQDMIGDTILSKV